MLTQIIEQYRGKKIELSGIKIHIILQNKLSFLTNYGIEFCVYDTIHLPTLEILWFVFGFVFILVFKNSTKKTK